MIGAGPAGSAAAKKSTDLGLKTILIEKTKMPRQKPCGGVLSNKTLKLINPKIPENIIDQYIKGVNIYSKTLKAIKLESSTPMGISTTRDRLDSYLVDLAIDSGCTFVQSKLIDIEIQKNQAKCNLEKIGIIKANIIIGADGVYSTTAQKTGIRQKWKNNEVALCLETKIETKNTDRIEKDTIELYFIGIPLGFGWFFPKKTTASVGIGGNLVYLKNPRKIFESFLKTMSTTKKIKINTSKLTAHLIPSGGFNRKLTSDKIILAGDAAGFVDPLTGEGIYYAIKSGQLAAITCATAIEEENMKATHLETIYSKICEKEFNKNLKTALQIDYLIHKYQDKFFSSLQNQHSTWINLIRGDLTYNQAKTKIIPKLPFIILKQKIASMMQHYR